MLRSATRLTVPLVAALAGCTLSWSAARAAEPSARALAEAARSARLATIDPSTAEEQGERTIGTWIAELTRGKVRKIDWSGGRCQLVVPESPRDAGGRGARCGHAVIHLARPLNRKDRPEIEVYFNLPKAGQPLEAYAFRGSMRGKDGEEYIRFTRDFEAVWRERFDQK